MRVYLDSSVLLRYLLSGDSLIKTFTPSNEVGSSELLEIECKRVLQRERLASHLDDNQYYTSLVLLEDVLDHLFIIELESSVKRRAAESFPTIVGTLGAIHLASAILWRDANSNSELCICTYDRQLEVCARTMGIHTISS